MPVKADVCVRLDLLVGIAAIEGHGIDLDGNYGLQKGVEATGRRRAQQLNTVVENSRMDHIVGLVTLRSITNLRSGYLRPCDS